MTKTTTPSAPAAPTPEPAPVVYRLSVLHTVPVVRVVEQTAKIKVRTDLFVRAASLAQAERTAWEQWQTDVMAEQLAASSAAWRDVREREKPIVVGNGRLQVQSVTPINADVAVALACAAGVPIWDATAARWPQPFGSWVTLGFPAAQKRAADAERLA
jgi:hypothetical protein